MSLWGNKKDAYGGNSKGKKKMKGPNFRLVPEIIQIKD